jgi:hypothetical protein
MYVAKYMDETKVPVVSKKKAGANAKKVTNVTKKPSNKSYQDAINYHIFSYVHIEVRCSTT